jgi:Zn-dependent protease
MIKPVVLSPGDDVHVVVTLFGAPLVTKGPSWLPLTQLITWGIMAREAGRLHPERSWRQRLCVSGLTTTVVLGSEWCHNLAHAAAAQWVGKPADAIRINLGMPLLVYYDIEDPEVSPRQHLIRALGGPLINAFFWGVASFLRRSSPSGTVARDVVDAAVNMNAFLCLGGMLPIPYIDGGVVFKWALVESGATPATADDVVQKANTLTSMGLAAGSALAFKRGKRFLGAVLAMLGITALLVGTGLLRETE